ncbi:unnamed protein product, partial [marine sediment metagenome]
MAGENCKILKINNTISINVRPGAVIDRGQPVTGKYRNIAKVNLTGVIDITGQQFHLITVVILPIFPITAVQPALGKNHKVI